MSGRSAGEHLPNFMIDDYLRMCRDGEAQFSISEAARVMGVSRMRVHRMMTLASVNDDDFEFVLDHLWKKHPSGCSLTNLADEIKRHTGRAKVYAEKCPACGHVLRERSR